MSCDSKASHLSCSFVGGEQRKVVGLCFDVHLPSWVPDCCVRFTLSRNRGIMFLSERGFQLSFPQLDRWVQLPSGADGPTCPHASSSAGPWDRPIKFGPMGGIQQLEHGHSTLVVPSRPPLSLPQTPDHHGLLLPVLQTLSSFCWFAAELNACILYFKKKKPAFISWLRSASLIFANMCSSVPSHWL